MNVFPAAADGPASDPGLWGDVLSVLVAIGGKAISVAVIIVACVAIAFVLRIVVRRIVQRIVNRAKVKANVEDTQALERSPLADMRLVQRTRTLGSILQNIINVMLVVVALILIVNTVDSSLLGSLTLLTAAVGAGLGFGAQNIVKDVLNGIFLVAEDQIGIGDVVDLGLASGVVEYVSVRITQVRDVNGTLWYVRNGEVTRIGNMSQGWARAIIDLGVLPDADLELVESTMMETAQALATDPKWRTRIIERPEVWGLESIDGDALVVRVVMKTRANAMDDVAQELRSRLRIALTDKDVLIPRMTSVTPSGLDGARRVRGANPPRTRPNPVTGLPRPTEHGIWRRKRSGGDSKEDEER
ncbi:mechanosensitive ion channel family protein [Microbacterium soli]|uniref:Mechanosensitive ion channel MscS domain-containing protein n=1 Tax=Microbacterium soli TaxID=446075 RepID=A0ABP7NJB6_9MICO